MAEALGDGLNFNISANSEGALKALNSLVEGMNRLNQTTEAMSSQMGNMANEQVRAFQQMTQAANAYAQRMANAAQETTEAFNAVNAKNGRGIVSSLRAIGTTATSVSGVIIHAISRVSLAVVGLNGYLAHAANSALAVGGGFESQMTRVQAVSGATGRELESLTKRARQMGETLPITAQNAAEAMLVMAQRGNKAVEILTNVEHVSNLAISQMLGMQRAADLLGSTMTNYELGMGEAARVTDVFNSACNNTALNMSKIDYGLRFVAAQAHAAGMSIEETVAAMGVLANTGLSGMMIGTGVRGMLQKMSSSTEMFGVRTKDTAGNMRNLLDVLQELHNKEITLSQANSAMGQRQAAAFLKLVQNPQKYAEILDILQNSSGETQKNVTLMMKTWENTKLALSSAIEGVRIDMFEQIKGGAKDATMSITYLTREFRRWMSEGQKAEQIFSSFFGGFGVQIPTVEHFRDILNSINIDAVAEGFGRFSRSLSGLVSSFYDVGKTFAPVLKLVTENLGTIFAGSVIVNFVGWLAKIPGILYSIASGLGFVNASLGAIGILLGLAGTVFGVKSLIDSNTQEKLDKLKAEDDAYRRKRNKDFLDLNKPYEHYFKTGYEDPAPFFEKFSMTDDIYAQEQAWIKQYAEGLRAEGEAKIASEVKSFEKLIKDNELAFEYLNDVKDMAEILKLSEEEKADKRKKQERKFNELFSKIRGGVEVKPEEINEAWNIFSKEQKQIAAYLMKEMGKWDDFKSNFDAKDAGIAEFEKGFKLIKDAQLKADTKKTPEFLKQEEMKTFNKLLTNILPDSLKSVTDKLKNAFDFMGEGDSPLLAFEDALKSVATQLDKDMKTNAQNAGLPLEIYQRKALKAIEPLTTIDPKAKIFFQELQTKWKILTNAISGYVKKAENSIKYMNGSAISAVPSMMNFIDSIDKIRLATGELTEEAKAAFDAFDKLFGLAENDLTERVKSYKRAREDGLTRPDQDRDFIEVRDAEVLTLLNQQYKKNIDSGMDAVRAFQKYEDQMKKFGEEHYGDSSFYIRRYRKMTGQDFESFKRYGGADEFRRFVPDTGVKGMTTLRNKLLLGIDDVRNSNQGSSYLQQLTNELKGTQGRQQQQQQQQEPEKKTITEQIQTAVQPLVDALKDNTAALRGEKAPLSEKAKQLNQKLEETTRKAAEASERWLAEVASISKGNGDIENPTETPSPTPPSDSAAVKLTEAVKDSAEVIAEKASDTPPSTPPVDSAAAELTEAIKDNTEAVIESAPDTSPSSGGGLLVGAASAVTEAAETVADAVEAVSEAVENVQTADDEFKAAFMQEISRQTESRDLLKSGNGNPIITQDILDKMLAARKSVEGLTETDAYKEFASGTDGVVGWADYMLRGRGAMPDEVVAVLDDASKVYSVAAEIFRDIPQAIIDKVNMSAGTADVGMMANFMPNLDIEPEIVTFLNYFHAMQEGLNSAKYAGLTEFASINDRTDALLEYIKTQSQHGELRRTDSNLSKNFNADDIRGNNTTLSHLRASDWMADLGLSFFNPIVNAGLNAVNFFTAEAGKAIFAQSAAQGAAEVFLARGGALASHAGMAALPGAVAGQAGMAALPGATATFVPHATSTIMGNLLLYEALAAAGIGSVGALGGAIFGARSLDELGGLGSSEYFDTIEQNVEAADDAVDNLVSNITDGIESINESVASGGFGEFISEVFSFGAKMAEAADNVKKYYSRIDVSNLIGEDNTSALFKKNSIKDSPSSRVLRKDLIRWGVLENRDDMDVVMEKYLSRVAEPKTEPIFKKSGYNRADIERVVGKERTDAMYNKYKLQDKAYFDVPSLTGVFGLKEFNDAALLDSIFGTGETKTIAQTIETVVEEASDSAVELVETVNDVIAEAETKIADLKPSEIPQMLLHRVRAATNMIPMIAQSEEYQNYVENMGIGSNILSTFLPEMAMPKELRDKFNLVSQSLRDAEAMFQLMYKLPIFTDETQRDYTTLATLISRARKSMTDDQFEALSNFGKSWMPWGEERPFASVRRIMNMRDYEKNNPDEIVFAEPLDDGLGLMDRVGLNMATSSRQIRRSITGELVDRADSKSGLIMALVAMITSMYMTARSNRSIFKLNENEELKNAQASLSGIGDIFGSMFGAKAAYAADMPAQDGLFSKDDIRAIIGDARTEELFKKHNIPDNKKIEGDYLGWLYDILEFRDLESVYKTLNGSEPQIAERAEEVVAAVEGVLTTAAEAVESANIPETAMSIPSKFLDKDGMPMIPTRLLQQLPVARRMLEGLKNNPDYMKVANSIGRSGAYLLAGDYALPDSVVEQLNIISDVFRAGHQAYRGLPSSMLRKIDTLDKMQGQVTAEQLGIPADVLTFVNMMDKIFKDISGRQYNGLIAKTTSFSEWWNWDEESKLPNMRRYEKEHPEIASQVQYDKELSRDYNFNDRWTGLATYTSLLQRATSFIEDLYLTAPGAALQTSRAAFNTLPPALLAAKDGLVFTGAGAAAGAAGGIATALGVQYLQGLAGVGLGNFLHSMWGTRTLDQFGDLQPMESRQEAPQETVIVEAPIKEPEPEKTGFEGRVSVPERINRWLGEVFDDFISMFSFGAKRAEAAELEDIAAESVNAPETASNKFLDKDGNPVIPTRLLQQLPVARKMLEGLKDIPEYMEIANSTLRSGAYLLAGDYGLPDNVVEQLNIISDIFRAGHQVYGELPSSMLDKINTLDEAQGQMTAEQLGIPADVLTFVNMMDKIFKDISGRQYNGLIAKSTSFDRWFFGEDGRKLRNMRNYERENPEIASQIQYDKELSRDYNFNERWTGMADIATFLQRAGFSLAGSAASQAGAAAGSTAAHSLGLGMYGGMGTIAAGAGLLYMAGGGLTHLLNALFGTRSLDQFGDLRPMDERNPVVEEITPVVEEIIPVVEERTPAVEERTPVVQEQEVKNEPSRIPQKVLHRGNAAVNLLNEVMDSDEYKQWSQSILSQLYYGFRGKDAMPDNLRNTFDTISTALKDAAVMYDTIVGSGANTPAEQKHFETLKSLLNKAQERLTTAQFASLLSFSGENNYSSSRRIGRFEMEETNNPDSIVYAEHQNYDAGLMTTFQRYFATGINSLGDFSRANEWLDYLNPMTLLGGLIDFGTNRGLGQLGLLEGEYESPLVNSMTTLDNYIRGLFATESEAPRTESEAPRNELPPLITQEDFEMMQSAFRSSLSSIITDEDLESMRNEPKTELPPLITKEDIEMMRNTSNLSPIITKEDLEAMRMPHGGAFLTPGSFEGIGFEMFSELPNRTAEAVFTAAFERFSGMIDSIMTSQEAVGSEDIYASGAKSGGFDETFGMSLAAKIEEGVNPIGSAISTMTGELGELRQEMRTYNESLAALNGTSSDSAASVGNVEVTINNPVVDSDERHEQLRREFREMISNYMPVATGGFA